jgi:ubiquinone/menaquinone biosynthesis C-methylase UbiE
VNFVFELKESRVDYKGYEYGLKPDHFWIKSHINLKKVLLSSINNTNVSGEECKVLAIGAGTGGDLAVLKEFGNIYAFDVDQNVLDMIPENMVVEKQLADAQAIPYGDSQFDIVVAFEVLEHIPDDGQAANEIKRVLKPGGFLIFSVPAFKMLFGPKDKAHFHMRRYNKKMIRKLLPDFKEHRIGYWMFTLFVPAAVQRVWEKSVINEKSYHPYIPAKLINSMFYKILQGENYLIRKGFNFPWGLTLYGIYQKI